MAILKTVLQTYDGYVANSKKRCRSPLVVVDLVLDSCANTYGVAPCTAAGAVGSECNNTFFTCQDTANFNKTTKTYRFCENVADIPAGVAIFPALGKMNLAPTKIEPNGIGQRASVTVTFKDFPHHDRGIDQYAGTRDYNATEQGSFFGKLKARNPHYINRKLVIRTGFIDPDNFDTTFDSDFQTRTYFIERIDGPDANGIVKVIAKDVLKLADKDRSQAPLLSDGELDAGIIDTDTSLVLAAGYSTTYPTAGTIRLNNEIITYTGKSGDTLTGLSRGQHNTIANSHNAGDVVQICLTYTAAKPSDVLEDLLITYAGVDPAFIPSADWGIENDTKLASHSMTVVIPEPTGVKELIEEVLQSTISYMWWDEITQEINFKVVFPVDNRTIVQSLDDTDHLVEDSVGVRDEEKRRLTEVIVYYDQHNPVDEEKKTNFSKVYAQVDTDAESANEYGVKATLEVISRWITTNGPAIEIAGRSLGLYKVTPKTIKFKLDAKDSVLKTGDFVTITTRNIQDKRGAEKPTIFLVLKRFERIPGALYEYEALEFSLGANTAYIGPNTLLDYLDESQSNKDLYGFISDNFGLMTNGADGYKIA